MDNSCVSKDFELRPESVLKLTCINESNKIIDNPIVLLIQPDNYCGDITFTTNNSYIFNNLDQGNITAIAGGGDYSPTPISFVISSESKVDKTLLLSKGNFINIQVLSPEFKPISGANVNFINANIYNMPLSFFIKKGFVSAEPSNFKTSHKGTFKIGPLPSGNYSIRIQKNAYSWKNIVRLPEGSPININTILK